MLSPEFKNVIYKITRKFDGKTYIGQTVKRGCDRQREHWNAALCTDDRLYDHRYQMLITRALRKYGVDAFTFEVIERCKTRELLDEREAFWIQELNTLSPNGFNLRSGPLGLTGAAIAPEVGYRISQANKGRVKGLEWRAALSRSHTGKKLTEEHKKKVGDAVRGRKESDETRLKKSVALKGRKLGPYSEERKAAISAGMTAEGKERSRSAHLGVKRSEETCEKLRKAWEIRRTREQIFGR